MELVTLVRMGTCNGTSYHFVPLELSTSLFVIGPKLKRVEALIGANLLTLTLGSLVISDPPLNHWTLGGGMQSILHLRMHCLPSLASASDNFWTNLGSI